MSLPAAEVLALLLLAALAAGYVDAVAGGGGLIQIPALVLALPGAAPLALLLTNKAAAVWGTSLAAVLYARRLRPPAASLVPLCLAAGAGAGTGAALAGHLPSSAFAPLVLALMVPVAALVALRPSLGVHPRDVPSVRARAAALGVAFAVGAWDGVFGPGTGILLTIGFVAAAGLVFLEAGGLARAANATTNAVALVVLTVLLARDGGPDALVTPWVLGVLLGAANLCGGWLGARTALARGSRFVRVGFLVVVAGLMVRLAWQVLEG